MDGATIGSATFEGTTARLTRPDGSAQALRPQTAHVLQVLLARADEVVGKDELMAEVWPDTFVGDDSLVQCISEIRKALGPDEAKRLVTVPRKGYRLSPGDTPASAAPPARRWPLAAAALLVLVALVAAATWALRPAPAPTGSITIGVLPFRDMSDSGDQSYLSNGVSEDLIVALSQVSDLRVLARGTTFALATEGGDLRALSTQLGADYLLEGSVWTLGDRLRLSASLVEGETGTSVWAERYEGTRADILGFQTKVLDQLVRVLSVRLSASERERLGVRGTTSIEAHDAYLKGRELENLYTKDANFAAERALREAIRHDPGFALAWSHLSMVLSLQAEARWAPNFERTVDEAYAAAERGVELGPDVPYAYFALGRLLTRNFRPDYDRAEAAYRKSIELDPNYVDGYVFLANIYLYQGKAEEMLPLIEEGYARNPVPPFWYPLAEGMAYFFTGHYAEAVAPLERARDQSPSAPFPHRLLLAAYGMLGDTDAAEWTAIEYEALGRRATVSAILETASVQVPAYTEMLAEGLRRAGLPED